MTGKAKPLAVALLYAVLALAWIFGSGSLLSEAVTDAATMHYLELAKGVLFVLVTSALLYGLMLRLENSSLARRRADEAALLDFHLANSPLAVIEFDGELRIRRWSGRAEEVFGWEAAEVCGQSLDELTLVDPVDLEAVLGVLQDLAQGREQRSFHRNINRTKSGEVRYCEWYNSVRRDETGRVESLLSLGLDVTDRKTALQALEESQVRYRSLFHNSHAVLLVTDPESGAILDANPAATGFYGWSHDELTARRINDINLLDADAIQAELQAARTAGRKFLNFRHRRADGSVVEVEVYSGRVEVGNKDLLLSVIHDVTDRRRAEHALLKSEAKFRALVEGAPDTIFVQAAGCFVFVNRAGCRLLGAADASQLIGQPVIDRVHPDYRDLARRRIQALNERREAQAAIEQVWLRLDGTAVDIEISGVPARYAGKNGALVFARDITDRKAAARKLDDNNRLMDMASAAARIGGWSVDLEKGTVHWSDEICRIHDIPPGSRVSQEQGIGFYAPEWQARIRDIFRACADEGTPYDEELEIVTARGRRIWVRTIGRAVRDVSGRIVSVQGAFQDIHDRKLAEQQLAMQGRRANRLLELPGLVETMEEDAFLEKAVDIVTELTGSSLGCLHLIDENDASMQRVCRSRHDQVATTADDAGFQLDEEHGHSEALRTRAPVILNDIAADTAGGSIRRQRCMTVPVRDNDRVAMLATVAGKPVDYEAFDQETLSLFADRIWSLVRNRRTGVRLRQLFQVIEQSPESIVITDLEPRIEYVNAAFCANTGYSRAELIGKNPRVLQSGETPRAHYQAMWAALSEGRSWKGEFYNRRKDGSQFVEFGHVAPMRGPDGVITHYIAIKEDITEKKRLARELDRHRHHLEEVVAQRTAELAEARLQAESANEAKSAFLANMSHEIRTPMNGVLGMIEVLASTSLNPHQQEMIEIIRESGRALAGVIDDILDFSKIEAGRLELEHSPISIRDLVEGLCDSLVPLAASLDVQLALFVSPDVPELVISDEVRVRQVLYNIVGNGIKFSRGRPERRGRVAVRVERHGVDRARIVFNVEDNGIGMAPEAVGRLFTPFSQAEVSTTRRFGGTGLGLTICRRIVDLMGGEIGVASEPGRGSTFTVHLPVEVPEEQPRRELPDVAGLHCLLVDSDAYGMEALAVYLLHAGADVQRVPSLPAAHSFRAADREPAVIVDYVGARVPGPPPPNDGLRSYGFVDITTGRPSGPEAIGTRVLLDETAQRMKTLLQAVAIAGGRVPAGEPNPDHAPSALELPGRTPSGIGTEILVVEDDEINRKVILKQLDLLGYSADIAENGAAALKMWRRGRYCLVLTDLHMPEMDGYMLTHSIRREESMVSREQRTPARIPIVALTANALRGEPERARAAGMDEYLTKPIKLQHLRDVLSRWLPDSPPPPPVPAANGNALELDVLRRLIGDNDAVVHDLLRNFLASVTTELEKIDVGLGGEDARAVAFAAHKLKSSSRSVGALQFGDLCARLEEAGKSGDLAAMTTLRTALDIEWAEVRRAASGALGVQESGPA